MMGRVLEIIYDYVDPGSYLTTIAVRRWMASGAGAAGVTVRWRPLELCPPGQPLINPRDPQWAAMTAALADDADQMGVVLRAPGQVPWSRKAHELALHASEVGGFDALQMALFQAHFEENDDVGRVDRLVELAARVGMDSAEVRTVLGVDRFLEAVEAERASLLGMGIRGVPTLRLNPDSEEERWLEGYQGLEVLNSALKLLEGADSHS
jgi:predicted DsbA family dithiol-disulfide isomerase